MVEPNAQEEAIFHAALEFDTPGQRSAYLDAACGERKDLRRRVEALLLRCAESAGPLDRPAGGLAVTADEPVLERPGSFIGPYQLQEQIGEGGMGLVFVADQKEPIKRRVALKVIKPGMDSRQVIIRFEAERQALAMMEHPNIAQVLDAGTTESGRPYFVMELVKGVPITEFCDQRKLTTRQRLELFLPICQAVQHAHQKGIIHRDLKPSNVLVTVHDVTPVVKIIDFGVAKAIGQQLTDNSVYTAFAQLIGTPLYMSPEQAGMSGLDIDTRSDIYSLGVLLYELLTGTTPFDGETLKKASYDELRRMIRDDEPPRPSARLSTLQQATLATVAECHGVEPRRLSQQVRGELDWIVMKCLEKDRNRRYETASALARDIERHLRDEPVEACPPRAGYRLKKFLKKHCVGVLVTAELLGVLLLAVVGLAVNNRLLREEQKRTEVARQDEANARQAEVKRLELARRALDAMTSEAIVNWLAQLKELSPEQKEFLKKALGWYEELAADTGQDEAARVGAAQAHLRVGYLRSHLGQTDAAGDAYRQAVRLFAQLVQDFPAVPAHRERLAASHNDLGTELHAIGKLEEAEQAYRRVLSLLTQLVKEDSTAPKYRMDLVAIHINLGRLLGQTGRRADAEQTYLQALPVQAQLVKDCPTEAKYRELLVGISVNLGNLLRDTERHVEAERLFRQALTAQTELVKDHPTVPAYREELAAIYRNLGILLKGRGRRDEARQAYREALTLDEQLVHDNPGAPAYRQGMAKTLTSLGELLRGSAGDAEAEQLYRRALTIQTKLLKDHPTVPAYRVDLAVSQTNLGVLLREIGRRGEAERSFREALALHTQLCKEFPQMPSYQHRLAVSHNNLGQLLQGTGQFEESPRQYHQALKLCQKLVTDYPNVAPYALALAQTYLNLANNKGITLSATLNWLGEAILTLNGLLAKDAGLAEARRTLRDSHRIRALVLSESRRNREALPDWDRAVALGEDKVPAIYLERARTLLYLAEHTRAAADALRAMELRVTDPQLGGLLHEVGVQLWETRCLPEAERAFRGAMSVFEKQTAGLPAGSPALASTHQQLGWSNFYLAMVLNAAGRPAEAIREYHRTFELAPGNRVAPPNFWPKVALARLLATCADVKLRDPVQALELAKTASTQLKWEAHSWSTLGMALYRNDDWSGSINALERAVQLRKNKDAVDWLFLAMAHWQRGEKVQAHEWYDRAIEWVDHIGPILRHRGPIGCVLASAQAGPLPLLAALQTKTRPAIGEDKGPHEELRVARAEAAALIGATAERKLATGKKP